MRRERLNGAVGAPFLPELRHPPLILSVTHAERAASGRDVCTRSIGPPRYVGWTDSDRTEARNEGMGERGKNGHGVAECFVGSAIWTMFGVQEVI